MERKRKSLFDIFDELFDQIELVDKHLRRANREVMWNPYREELVPLTHIRDEVDYVVITADLPYVRNLNDIDITMTESEISIRARMCRTVKYEKWIPGFKDVEYKQWAKTIHLPFLINPSKATVRFKEHILEIRVPKKLS